MATALLPTRSPLVARRARATPFCSTARRAVLPAASSKHVADVAKAVPEASSNVLATLSAPALASLIGCLVVAGPAEAMEATNPFNGVQANSLYVTLALFLMSAPGIWSLVKRAPQATKKRMTFEVPGPAVEGARTLDDRAREIFRYFKRYNYTVKETGEVITFEGIYAADKGQAAALVFYMFASLASVALVLSILVPQVGNWWYGMTALSPGAYFYYMRKGERPEQFKVKMVTSNDEQTTDITVEGDKEEIERFWKELGLVEKGKVLVPGLMA